jgi:hypothetical protein
VILHSRRHCEPRSGAAIPYLAREGAKKKIKARSSGDLFAPFPFLRAFA